MGRKAWPADSPTSNYSDINVLAEKTGERYSDSLFSQPSWVYNHFTIKNTCKAVYLGIWRGAHILQNSGFIWDSGTCLSAPAPCVTTPPGPETRGGHRLRPRLTEHRAALASPEAGHTPSHPKLIFTGRGLGCNCMRKVEEHCILLCLNQKPGPQSPRMAPLWSFYQTSTFHSLPSPSEYPEITSVSRVPTISTCRGCICSQTSRGHLRKPE